MTQENQEQDEDSGPLLILRDTIKGKGVFAARDIEKDKMMLRFQGTLFTRSQYMTCADFHNNHFLQISSDYFLGPSGSVDDYINHSCEPNAGIRFGIDAISLVAIRFIFRDEEICFDYSTTMAEDFWEMKCSCGSPSCRRTVRDFIHLPERTRDQYISMGIVPRFVLNGSGPR